MVLPRAFRTVQAVCCQLLQFRGSWNCNLELKIKF